jgi:hypothetical protein
MASKVWKRLCIASHFINLIFFKTLWHTKIRQNYTTQCIQQALEMGNTSEFNLYPILHCITATVHAVQLDWNTHKKTNKQRQVAADMLQQGASSCARWPISVTWLKCLLMCGSVSYTGISVLQKYLSISAQNFSLISLCSCILDQKFFLILTTFKILFTNKCTFY